MTKEEYMDALEWAQDKADDFLTYKSGDAYPHEINAVHVTLDALHELSERIKFNCATHPAHAFEPWTQYDPA